MHKISMIITGGQTGVDRAALDFAIQNSIPYAGWCPAGGWAEDLILPPGLLTKYPKLSATPSIEPAQRTEWNVRDSDATIILSSDVNYSKSRGTVLTAEMAAKYNKEYLNVCISSNDCMKQFSDWASSKLLSRLNIAGPRESEYPGTYNLTIKFLNTLHSVGCF